VEEDGLQRLFPIVDAKGNMMGVIPRWDLTQFVEGQKGATIHELIHKDPMVAYGDEPLRFVVQRMAASGLTKFPVVERTAPARPVGMIALTDLLKARIANIESEQRREQVLRLGLPLMFRSQNEIPEVLEED